ncbi:MAG: hypothetical protein ABW098_01805 [Candidatus Thiodiazotropha sp.]
MIQIHTTKALSADLKSHLIEVPATQGAMQWYAHRVHVMRRKCVIAMEAQSRYAMVFTGLKKPDFERLPELFLDRLMREALSICQLDEERSDHLASLVMMLGESIQISQGSDRSVQTHINEVARELDWMSYEIGCLPENDEDEFSFGLRVNQTPRKRKGDKDYFYPLEELRGFWLGLLERVVAIPDNDVPLH